MDSSDQIQHTVSGPIATITFSRPERLNAWTPIMESEVADLVASLGTKQEIRAIVFTGAGRGFCAGADLSGGAGNAGGASAPRQPGPERFKFLWDSPKLLVAAVNGPAAGVGLSIALHCDLRFIADNASVTTAFARRGLIAEHGSAWLLTRLIGFQNSTDLLMSARKVEAAEAACMGLARLLPAQDFLERVVTETQELISQSSPRSLAVIKTQLRASFEQTYADAQTMAFQEQLASLKSDDFIEGVRAFRERRPPVFSGN
jgi:enoyl-CoA hydratase/carnithine racemase